MSGIAPGVMFLDLYEYATGRLADKRIEGTVVPGDRSSDGREHQFRQRPATWDG